MPYFEDEGCHAYTSLPPLSLWFGMCIFLEEGFQELETTMESFFKGNSLLSNIPKTSYLVSSMV